MAYTELALYVDSVAYSAVAQWAATHAYTVGQIVRQLAAPAANNERCFICIVAGTSLSTEPTWVLTRGAKTTEAAGPTWMECTGLPALCADNTNTNAWHASAGAIALGWIIKNVANDHYFIATTAGTGGTGTEPTWNTTTGATTTDNTVTWTCIGATLSFTTKWAAAHARVNNGVGSSNWLLNSGMNVFVGDDHSETQASNYSLTVVPGGGGLTSVLCVDHTAALPPTSANLKTTAVLAASGGASSSVNTNGVSPVYIYGLQFTGNSPGIGAGSTSTPGWKFRYEQCLFSIIFSGSNQMTIGNGSGSPASGCNEFKDCTFHIQVASSQYIFLWCGQIRMQNCSFTGTIGGAGSAPLFEGSNGIETWAVMEGCDFSNYASGGAGLFGSPFAGSIVLKDCIIPAGIPIYATGDVAMREGTVIDLSRCDSGSAAYRNERHNTNAVETTSTTVVRTGGASDGATPISHQIATTANANNAVKFFDAIPLVIWNAVTGTNRNVTVYGIANDSRVPNNDEVWFDVEYLGSASTTKASYARGGKVALATASALTADSTSAWDSAATARANTHAYNVGDVIKTASNPGRIFFCVTSGTSAGSEPGGYATAVDGGSVTDSGATFRAGCRFSQTVVLSSPQPQQAGYLYAYPRIGRPSMTYYIDPLIVLS